MKLRNILTSLAFILMLALFSAGHLLTPDKDISVSERRPLEQLPKFSVQTLMNGKFGEDLEDYLLDQFPLRDAIRSLQATTYASWTATSSKRKSTRSLPTPTRCMKAICRACM